MVTASKNTFRFLGLASISLLLAIGLSCKKDNKNPDPTGGGGTGGAALEEVITADINFVEDGVSVNYKGYYSGANIRLFNDTLHIAFEAEDKYGNELQDGIILSIFIDDASGIQAGSTYILTDDGDQFAFVKKGLDYDVGNFAYYSTASNPGELKITSISQNQIKGTFSFLALEPFTQKQAIVSNGKFDCKLIRM